MQVQKLIKIEQQSINDQLRLIISKKPQTSLFNSNSNGNEDSKANANAKKSFSNTIIEKTSNTIKTISDNNKQNLFNGICRTTEL
jgi:hypothetical protein